jgi:hypothetical protein
VSGTRCSPLAVRRALAAGAVLVALLGCPTREPDTRPFHVEGRRATGESIADGVTEADLFVFHGTASVPEPTTLQVGDVTFHFDRAALPELAFPARLEGQQVVVELIIDPVGVGPAGEPLRIPGLRVATGNATPTYELAIAEATYEEPTSGLAAIPRPVGPEFGGEDLPAFSVGTDWVEYEPAECGLAYYDFLRVFGGDRDLTLKHGERGQVFVGTRAEAWTIAHVVSWHRRGQCNGQSKTWTQFAAWR